MDCEEAKEGDGVGALGVGASCVGVGCWVAWIP